MELTREQIKAFEKCGESRTCEKCPAKMHCSEIGQFEATSIMAKQLLAEMDKPGVWDESPEYAGVAQVAFSKSIKEPQTIWSRAYTRELPKSRARQIAEEYTEKWDKLDPSLSGMSRADTIEQAILKYAEENK